MSRYIDAENILYSSVMVEEDNGNYRKMWIATKEDIDAIPTADVRENVKGEWIDCGVHGDWAWEMDGHGNCWHIWKCSKCEYKTEHCNNYCPNCGADMRGEA